MTLLPIGVVQEKNSEYSTNITKTLKKFQRGRCRSKQYI